MEEWMIADNVFNLLSLAFSFILLSALLLMHTHDTRRRRLWDGRARAPLCRDLRQPAACFTGCCHILFFLDLPSHPSPIPLSPPFFTFFLLSTCLFTFPLQLSSSKVHARAGWCCCNGMTFKSVFSPSSLFFSLFLILITSQVMSTWPECEKTGFDRAATKKCVPSPLFFSYFLFIFLIHATSPTFYLFSPLLAPLPHATISFTGSTSTRERVKTRGHDCKERPRRPVGHPLDVQRKRGKRTLQYLIKWKGFPSSEASG